MRGDRERVRGRERVLWRATLHAQKRGENLVTGRAPVDFCRRHSIRAGAAAAAAGSRAPPPIHTHYAARRGSKYYLIGWIGLAGFAGLDRFGGRGGHGRKVKARGWGWQRAFCLRNWPVGFRLIQRDGSIVP